MSATQKKTTNKRMYGGQRVQRRRRGGASSGSVCSAGSESVCDIATQPVVSMIHNPSGELMLSRDFRNRRKAGSPQRRRVRGKNRFSNPQKSMSGDGRHDSALQSNG